MGRNVSVLDYLNWEIYAQVFVGFILIYSIPFSRGYTNPEDVTAINNLYVAFESPTLPGWVAVGGDPCADAWQGVQCDTTDISSITLNGANLGGELGDNLGSFSSIKSIDLSNNRIGGSIPSSLPLTMQNLFLSDNKFSGSLPSSLSSLTQLAAMSVNNNQLTGEIPDAFQGLTALVNLDMSSNNLSGELPPSLESLSSLTTLRLQNNQLSGTLDVLQDLPLRDLNVENNLFSGPIPDKLLSIANFKKDGNPFNTSVSPLPPATSTTPPSPSPPFFVVPSSGQTPPARQNSTKQTPGKQADGPSTREESNSRTTKKNSNTKKIVGISIASVLALVILALVLLFILPRFCRGRKEVARIPKRHEIAPYTGSVENPREDGSFVQRDNQIEQGPKAAVLKPKEEHQTGLGRAKPQNDEVLNVQRASRIPKHDNHERPISRFELDLMPPPPPPLPPPSPPPPTSPPPPPPPPTSEKVIIKPSAKPLVPQTSVKSFSIASLQQYTNSFSQENLIGGGMLGSVYRAQLPNGKLIAVKKLDRRAASQQKDDEFINLVNNIDKIRHANVVQLVGYCAEHGQRLLIYEYCSNGTLQDALHSDDEFKKKLSWNSRVRMALGAARALEYLHEFCDPPVVHRNFKAANVLLDDELAVHVSDCGLAPLISSGSVSQLSGQLLSAYGYGAPEFETGIYTFMSDVYSFGVVMLELLTGRKSYDRERNRGEQFLVRWAMPQLHDIDALSRMVDPSLDGAYPVKSLSHFADIILRCVQTEPEFRPPMSEVVQDLTEMIRRDSSK